MPILKVSNDIKKYALEVVRIPISILGDCPKCQSNGFREGICPDCYFIDPRVEEAIQEWQAAMGIQQVVKQQQESLAEQNPNAKAAYRSLAFTDIFPGNFQGLDPDGPSGGKVKCPRCGNLSFNNESMKKGVLSGSCENQNCLHEIAGDLGFKRPKFLGIDPRMVKKIQRNFLSPAGKKIENNKNKLKKKSAKEQSLQEAIAANPGAQQDDSMNASMDATTRMKNMLQQNAQVDSQEKYNDNANNSEEL